MMGGKEPENRGLIPRIAQALFDHADAKTTSSTSFKIEASYIEIYAERVKDLLNPPKNREKVGEIIYCL